MTVSLTSVIAIGIHDRPGEFAKAMRILADEHIAIEYMYAFISRDKGKAFVILRVDDDQRAVSVLQDSGSPSSQRKRSTACKKRVRFP